MSPSTTRVNWDFSYVPTHANFFCTPFNEAEILLQCTLTKMPGYMPRIHLGYSMDKVGPDCFRLLNSCHIASSIQFISLKRGSNHLSKKRGSNRTAHVSQSFRHLLNHEHYQHLLTTQYFSGSSTKTAFSFLFQFSHLYSFSFCSIHHTMQLTWPVPLPPKTLLFSQVLSKLSHFSKYLKP
jgi:hypothetical protein